MATHIAIDPELLDQILRLSGEKTKKAAVTLALHEFIARREQAKILELVGTLEWNESFDYKSERSRI
ncbi:antitoxin of type II TA system, VapB [Paramicrobacterium humi]|uniref:Antitoxin of type II TA system, VapB n=1 Tax=Paramicrobacterium humi TaxID=640635 RepID=A0A1H4KTN0_9MICO|nr:type II toxin-antitoxin system VapB family antitoxin [Microbacterium humi]SEB61894.1 antitoxin of type II TA system, VapB [Microbacterium humi]